MKKFYLLILLLSISFSQDIKFFGTILDFETKEPIIDANIVFIGSDFGSASDLNGNFSVTNLQKQEYEILISAIGYKDIIASVNLINQDSYVFELIPEPVLSSALNVVGRFPQNIFLILLKIYLMKKFRTIIIKLCLNSLEILEG